MIEDRIANGFSPFVIPFMVGMAFVLGYCIIGMVRLFLQLPGEDRKKFLVSLITPSTMLKNVRNLFLDCLFHVKLWKRKPLLGYMHSSIAFGWFMIILLGHIEVALFLPHRLKTFYYPIFFNYFVAEEGRTLKGSVFFFLMDFFLLVILSGIILAIIKRIRSRWFGMRRTTKLTAVDRIGLYSLWLIFPLRLLAEGFTAHISGGSFLTMPVNWVVQHVFSSPGFFDNNLHMLPTWWAYSIDLAVFMFVLPFSRYMHIPAEMLLIPMRNAGLKIRNARKGFAKAEVYSCPSCGVCIDACPMTVKKANVKYSTVYLNRQIRRGNEDKIEEISDKCLMCGKCSAVCQVGVQGPELRVAQRAVRKYAVPGDFSSINTVPLTIAAGQGTGNVAYFAGCMTALTPGISRSVESLLKKSGVDYKFLDRDGGLCCGRPMLMAGRIKEAHQIMAKNREIILSSGCDTLLVSCPICYKVFKENYDLEAAGVKVLHHSVYFESLAASGKLKIEHDLLNLVFHDPCELGRGSGIYEQPRNLLALAGNLVGAEQDRKMSICCGGSLGSLTLDFQQREDMTRNALKNLCADVPDIIVTACPLCRSTLRRYADRPVLDISEVVDRFAVARGLERSA